VIRVCIQVVILTPPKASDGSKLVNQRLGQGFEEDGEAPGGDVAMYDGETRNLVVYTEGYQSFTINQVGSHNHPSLVVIFFSSHQSADMERNVSS
jgi:hypothetical protein